MKNKLAITSLIILLASVPLIVHVVSADGILSLPDDELLTEFAYEWGPGTVTISDWPGPGVLFDFIGLSTTSGTGVGDNFPVSDKAGGVHKDYGSGFSGPYDFSGYSKYCMYVTNLETEPISVCLKMNTGWTDSPWGTPERDTYWQSCWVTIPPSKTAPVELDFSCCGEVWNAEDDPDPAWQYPDGSSGWPIHRLDEVSQIGFQVLGDGEVSIIVSNEPPEGFGVIPEVPLGTIIASAAMIIALVAYVTVPKWRRKQQYVNL